MPNNVGSGVWAESVLVMQTPAGAVLREEALGGFLGVVAVRGVDRVLFFSGIPVGLWVFSSVRCETRPRRFMNWPRKSSRTVMRQVEECTGRVVSIEEMFR